MAGTGCSLRMRAFRAECTIASVMCALLMGCAANGTEIATLGSVRNGPQIPIRVAAGEVLPLEKWPQACQLIERDDVLAILPDATRIDQTSLRGSTRTIKEFLADEFWHESEAPTEAGCMYSFHLPGGATEPSSVWVEITEIADPKVTQRYHEQERASDDGSTDDIPGVDDCYLHHRYDPQLICLRGPMRFAVGGTTSAVFGESGDALSYWRDEVLPRFATSVGNKIGGEEARPASES
jgi:hypothetical protein